MPGRRRAPRSLRRWFLGGSITLALVGAAAFFLLRGGELPQPVAREEPVPPFEFAVEDVRFTSVGRAKKPNEQRREEIAGGLVETMNTLYDAAFVAPDQWADGTFPKVVEAFAPGTVDAAQRDLAELTLGPGSARITRVVPAESRLDVGILLSKKEPVAAVARTAFGADATVRGGGSVRVSHGGTYFLRMIDGTWKIVGYDVDGSIESVDPQAGPTPTGSAG